jgi:hypothetical protein
MIGYGQTGHIQDNSDIGKTIKGTKESWVGNGKGLKWFSATPWPLVRANSEMPNEEAEVRE